MGTCQARWGDHLPLLVSDHTGPKGPSTGFQGAGFGAVGDSAGTIAERGAEGQGAQGELMDVPLPPLLLNLQLHLEGDQPSA